MVYVDNERKRDLGKVWRSIYRDLDNCNIIVNNKCARKGAA